ncbi:MAG TPA: PKD domain-containing protein, partial [Bacteroidia bacterium]
MRSKTGITVLLVFFVTVTGIFAQPTPGAYNQWYFGAHARTSIAPPGPITGPTSENTQEGCACYCDQNGAILFYTDGITVWNAAGVACPTQLNGSPNTPGGSAAQGVVIVPMVPQNIHTVNLFYIFTVSDANSATPLNNGLTYYIYSATTNSIISGPSQPTFNSYTTEGLTAIPHCNGQDYWIIVKPVINPTNISPANTFFPNNPFSASDNSIYAYLLDASGLSNTPVISNFLPGQGFYPTTTGNSYNWISTMKSSPDRSLFAIGERAANTGTGGFMNFFSFNCGTGIFDFINRVPQTLFPYGLSFSPDSKNLYACNGAAKVRVYDVSNIACDPTIPHNDLTISNVINDDIYQLQLAPDATTGQVVPHGTILMTHPLTANTTLARFVTPNTPLAPGNYVVNSLFLSPGQSAWVGLPNNIDGQVVNPVPEPVDFTICPCNCKVDFKLTGCGNTISWNFGDGSTVSGTVGAPITPTENTWGNYSAPSHTYVNPGTYVITMVVTTNTPSGPVTQQVGHTVAYNPIGNTCSKWEVSEPSAPLGSSGGNDILTDKYGNVYVGGVFDNNMIFDGLGVCPDITLNGVGPSTRTAYIAKYNNCGELLWVNFENASGTSEGHSLALDPVRDEVYLAGFASGLITFNKVPNSPCGPTIIVGTLSNNGPVYQPFLARFNALTGGYLDGIYGTALPPNIVSFKVPVSIACENTGPLSTDIFYSVAYLTNSIGGGGN